MEYFSSNFKLGILGGGQLGKMLLYTTRKFDIYTSVLDPNPEAPSKLACNEFFEGDLMDYETVYNFGKKVNTLTIEIENVNVDALKALEKDNFQTHCPKNLDQTFLNELRHPLSVRSLLLQLHNKGIK